MSFPKTGTHTDVIEKAIEEATAQDIIPANNLGSFVTTNQDSAATRLMTLNSDKNHACVGEYTSIANFHQDCVSMLADLWNKQDSETPFGTATTGSSEAVLLAGIAMKRYWQEKKNSSAEEGGSLNIVVGSNCHLCVLKFALYFDIEARVIPVSEDSGHKFDATKMEDYLDHKTIGVFLTLGSTYTGHYDPVAEVAACLDGYEARTGYNIPIHVDAASGGFVAPFAHGNTVNWDFNLPRVRSINTSGHKFGLAPCAVGWVVWRDHSFVPESLILESSYLRGTQLAFTLSFSRPSAPVAVQYYHLRRLGRDGYQKAINTLLSTARALSFRLEDTGYFRCISTIHRYVSGHKPLLSALQQSEPGLNIRTHCHHHRDSFESGLPVVVFTFSDAFKQRCPWVSLSHVSDRMHHRKVAIPHYALNGWGKHFQNIDVLRIVVRSHEMDEMMEKIVADLVGVIEE